jgi:hypothetical protein
LAENAENDIDLKKRKGGKKLGAGATTSNLVETSTAKGSDMAMNEKKKRSNCNARPDSK